MPGDKSASGREGTEDPRQPATPAAYSTVTAPRFLSRQFQYQAIRTLTS